MEKTELTKEVLSSFEKTASEDTVDITSKDGSVYSLRVKTDLPFSDRITMAYEVANLCIRDDGSRFVGTDEAAAVACLFDTCVLSDDSDIDISIDCAYRFAQDTDFLDVVLRKSFDFDRDEFFAEVDEIIVGKTENRYKKFDDLIDLAYNLISNLSDNFESLDVRALNDLAKKIGSIDEAEVVNTVLKANEQHGIFNPKDVIVKKAEEKV